MKILVTGSFCCGKTTISRYIQSNVPGSYLLSEPIRELASVFRINQLENLISRHYLIVRQMFEEKKAELQHQTVICDAGIESNLAHSRLWDFPVEQQIDGLAHMEHQRYDLIFFCDHQHIPVVSDGFRLEDEAIRARLAQLILSALKDLGYETPIVLTGSIESRKHVILEKIRQLYEK
jgi:nicotinamide riboside kinase